MDSADTDSTNPLLASTLSTGHVLRVHGEPLNEDLPVNLMGLLAILRDMEVVRLQAYVLPIPGLQHQP